MFWDIQKFEKEIKALKSLKERDFLKPFTKQTIKFAVLREGSRSKANNAPIFKTSFFYMGGGFFRYAAFVLAGLAMFAGTAMASQKSLPGDFLYPVKKVSENLELKFSISEESKAKVESKHAERRFTELKILDNKVWGIADGNLGEQINDNHWTSSAVGTDIIVSTSTNTNATGTKDNPGEQIRAQARQDARVQLNRAVSALIKVQVKLESQGNTEAASAIGKNILKLQEHAQELEIVTEPKVQGLRKGNDQKEQEKQPEKVRVKTETEIEANIQPPA